MLREDISESRELKSGDSMSRLAINTAAGIAIIPTLVINQEDRRLDFDRKINTKKIASVRHKDINAPLEYDSTKARGRTTRDNGTLQ